MKMRIEVQKLWKKYKYAMVAALLGTAMLLWSGIPLQKQENQGSLPEAGIGMEAAALQVQIEEILRNVEGVGEVRVLLTLESDGERQLARDTKLEYRGATAAPEDYSKSAETVLVDSGSGEEAVVTGQTCPVYRGALVVCQGAERADVQLAVTQAVSVLTGLSRDRVAVAKWQ